ncbi:hypothetical protein HELRODRAFT_191688 [Helobdella robusta]|uniref:protein-tyrosine-phosphatase n=1 Tax=Helobdella robusta TaxID=6412 RepID=T1FT76_HELRO|nr:hypothetical protein HELRODRAFT_191688 [Helobdella robusta]ESO04681.1 hypothetical protein HELRODRAFT_191688 [Helobdella robusta]
MSDYDPSENSVRQKSTDTLMHSVLSLLKVFMCKCPLISITIFLLVTAHSFFQANLEEVREKKLDVEVYDVTRRQQEQAILHLSDDEMMNCPVINASDLVIKLLEPTFITSIELYNYNDESLDTLIEVTLEGTKKIEDRFNKIICAKRYELPHKTRICGRDPMFAKAIHLNDLASRNHLQLCEIKIFTCLPGYFNNTCNQTCHCMNQAVCRVENGQCPNLICDYGWKGISCQEACREGWFGSNCRHECHCAGAVACDITDGRCPRDLCDPLWFGYSCQTTLPKPTSTPYTSFETSDSINILWNCHNEENVVDGLSMMFAVLYKRVGRFEEFDGSEVDDDLTGSQGDGDVRQREKMNTEDVLKVVIGDNVLQAYENSSTNYLTIVNRLLEGWAVADLKVPYLQGKYTYETNIPNLKFNTNYTFCVFGYLLLPNNRVVWGELSLSSNNLKTSCKAPRSVLIQNVTSFTEELSGPIIYVLWKKLLPSETNCDKVLYYEIFYQEQQASFSSSSPWMKETVPPDRHDCYLTRDVLSGRNYQVKLVAVNNGRLESSSDLYLVSTPYDENNGSYPGLSDAHVDGMSTAKVGALGVTSTVIFLAAACSAVAFLLWRKKKAKKLKNYDKLCHQPPTTSHVCMANDVLSNSSNEVQAKIVIRPSSRVLTADQVTDLGGRVRSYRGSSAANNTSNHRVYEDFILPKSVHVRSMSDIEKLGHPIKLQDLEEFLQSEMNDGYETLRQEFDEIPAESPEATKIAGTNSFNITKNRFKDVIACDQTRVVLKRANSSNNNFNEPLTDYINANYIDVVHFLIGHKKERFYIATQGLYCFLMFNLFAIGSSSFTSSSSSLHHLGIIVFIITIIILLTAPGCKKNTIVDFWGMIWQEQCRRVVMVTNLVERSTIKCHQYWPDKLNSTRVYGDIAVRLTDVIKLTYFTVRSLDVRRGSETRSVKQFHFTAWPDQKVPEKLAQVVTFRNKIRSHDVTHGGVIVVHCSAGIGRSGAFIAMDRLLDEMEDGEEVVGVGERMVDVMKTTTMLRMQRCNMEQYIFLYQAVLEAYKFGNTIIQGSKIRQTVDAILKQNGVNGRSCLLEEQYELLQKVAMESTATITSSSFEVTLCALEPDNVDKNRYSTVLPDDKSRPFLTSVVEGTNDYINATYLNGYKYRNAYITTQMPLPQTVVDFWRLVFEHDCRVVVMLNFFQPDSQQSHGQYWPEDGEESECGPFLLRCLSFKRYGGVSARVVLLSYLSEFKSDEKFEMVCRDVSRLMGLMDAESCNVDVDLPVIVHCDDGQTISGMFVALCQIREQLQEEHEVDVFQIVRSIVCTRPGTFPHLGQLHFSYLMAVYFAEQQQQHQ